MNEWDKNAAETKRLKNSKSMEVLILRLLLAGLSACRPGLRMTAKKNQFPQFGQNRGRLATRTTTKMALTTSSGSGAEAGEATRNQGLRAVWNTGALQ